MPDPNAGRPGFVKTISGKWRYAGEPDEIKKATKCRRKETRGRKPRSKQTGQFEVDHASRAKKDTTAIEKVLAGRLAEVDFYYILDPDQAEEIVHVSKIQAARLRKTAVYKHRLGSLNRRASQKANKDVDKSGEKMREAMESLVPKAIEVLRDHLNAEGDVLSLQAAREVLDRDGRLAKTMRVQNQNLGEAKVPTATEELLAEFREAGKPKTVVH